jgi:hypothetical protein
MASAISSAVPGRPAGAVRLAAREVLALLEAMKESEQPEVRYFSRPVLQRGREIPIRYCGSPTRWSRS